MINNLNKTKLEMIRRLVKKYKILNHPSILEIFYRLSLSQNPR